jgi:hypothetical protein
LKEVASKQPIEMGWLSAKNKVDYGKFHAHKHPILGPKTSKKHFIPISSTPKLPVFTTAHKMMAINSLDSHLENF